MFLALAIAPFSALLFAVVLYLRSPFWGCGKDKANVRGARHCLQSLSTDTLWQGRHNTNPTSPYVSVFS